MLSRFPRASRDLKFTGHHHLHDLFHGLLQSRIIHEPVTLGVRLKTAKSPQNETKVRKLYLASAGAIHFGMKPNNTLECFSIFTLCQVPNEQSSPERIRMSSYRITNTELDL